MTEKTDKTLLLVDGSSYLYRAYHALPDLRGPDNFPTGAIHGMVGMMKWLRDRIPCEHAACVFDAKGPTFRDEWYAEYKATRTAMPEDLARQIEPIHEVVKLLGWPVLEVPGVEADDVIGTLACAAAKGGHKVVISTGDKDLAQLVTPQVSLINTMSKPPEVLDWPAFESLAFRDIDREGLLAFFSRYGLKTLRRELETSTPSTPGEGGAPDVAVDDLFGPAPERRYDTVLTHDALDAWVAKISAAPLTAIDTET